MSKIITVIYGSSTGNTEHAAQLIAGKLGGRAVNIRNASAADFQADLLILGTSTWGCGELQDDWMHGVALLCKFASRQRAQLSVFDQIIAVVLRVFNLCIGENV